MSLGSWLWWVVTGDGRCRCGRIRSACICHIDRAHIQRRAMKGQQPDPNRGRRRR